MNCLQCNNTNPATVQYCQRCGAKLNLTADEIRDTLIQRVEVERAGKTAQNARQGLVFGIVVFLVAVTLFLAVGKAPSGALHLPSASKDAGYVEIRYRYEPDIPKLLVPYNTQRKP
jgi:hypothetical protein